MLDYLKVCNYFEYENFIKSKLSIDLLLINLITLLKILFPLELMHLFY